MKTNKKNIFQLLFIKSELHKGRTFKDIRHIYKEQLEEIKGMTPEEIKEATDNFYKFYWRYFTKKKCKTSNSLENLEQEERLF